MGRIRTIKPEYFTSKDIVKLEPIARLVYIALWCEADREGRLAWDPETIKLRYFPAESFDEIQRASDALLTRGLLVTYEHDGCLYAFIPKFKIHQQINGNERSSGLPTPPVEPKIGTRHQRVTNASPTRHPHDDGATVTRDDRNGTMSSGKERKGKEGEGKEALSDNQELTGETPAKLPQVPPGEFEKKIIRTASKRSGMALPSIGLSDDEIAESERKRAAIAAMRGDR